MFLQDYKDSSLSYDDAQFVIALALDGLGEDKAARAVLFFMSPQAKNNTGNSPYKTRAELVQGMEDISREQKKDIITTALDYYFSYPVSVTNRILRNQSKAPVMNRLNAVFAYTNAGS